MIMTATIRHEITEFMEDNNMTINQLARLSSINSGSLSSILNGNRPMSVNQIDRITESMGLTDGHFYDRYIYECIFHTTPDWRRLGAFLERCATLNKLDCLHVAARMTMENITYAPMLFDLAETFYNEEKYKAAAILYECVAESEKFQHSERLALCHYRLFLHSSSDNQETNWQAVVLFEPYIERLNESYQLDAYQNLINIYVSLTQWDKAASLAVRMGSKAMAGYENPHSGYQGRHPHIFYILYSYLIRAGHYYECRDYEQALYYVGLYEKPDFIKKPTEDECKIIEQFREWAEANRYLFGLMSGQLDVLKKYVDYVASREDEIFLAICSIMIAANRYQLHVDPILDRFKEHLHYRPQKNQISTISEQVTMSRYTRLLAELGIYYLNSKQYDRGLSYILDSLEYSIRIKSDNGMLRCMGIFEQFRHSSSEEILRRYDELIGAVQKLSVYAWSPVV
ncbi:helix-turn-helix domain-containing protein [Paenibacillus solani]|uniref:helix-turn-helix domain-containing protein n=1 Tax=Paenibacillus solani TaxID=1705565 RepID=UPI000ACBB88B|nr:helix-turn-helix domain-containing protein [Paenibacillus solani]